MVEVFKTDVYDPVVARNIAEWLKTLIPGSEINFDLDDCDKILRVEGRNIVAKEVEMLVEERGFRCSTLD